MPYRAWSNILKKRVSASSQVPNSEKQMKYSVHCMTTCFHLFPGVWNPWWIMKPKVLTRLLKWNNTKLYSDMVLAWVEMQVFDRRWKPSGVLSSVSLGIKIHLADPYGHNIHWLLNAWIIKLLMSLRTTIPSIWTGVQSIQGSVMFCNICDLIHLPYFIIMAVLRLDSRDWEKSFK